MEEAIQVPKTALDVFRMLPEGTLCEVIDNVLYMSPAPKYNHQKLVGLFFKRIIDHVESHQLGITVVSPADVYLEELLSAVQPDVLFVSNANMHILHDDGYFYGTPDLIVEVLSGDKKRDTITKKNLYERAGVKEYFIVNPADRKVIAYELKDNSFQLAYESEGLFKSYLLNFEFSF